MPPHRKLHYNQTLRMPRRDYTRGWYFITVCTLHRQQAFGVVTAGVMHRSTVGTIAAEEWQRTVIVRPNVTIDAFIVMPDHVHAIIGIDTGAASRRDAAAENPPRLRAGSLGAIVCQWKSLVTKRARAAGYVDFAWQSRYHDVIIRDQRHLDNVRRYIEDNPRRWQ
jgi:REP element-mobilizing transposase RayT